MYSPGLKFTITIKQNNGKYLLTKSELSRNKYAHERLQNIYNKIITAASNLV